MPLPKTSNELVREAQTDIGFNCTPDLPQRRYYGPHKVFLWDTVRLNVNTELMRNLGLEAGRDSRIEYFGAVTCAHMIPVMNVAEDTRLGRGFYLMTPGDWREGLCDTHKEIFKESPPMNVAGRVVSLSVRALQALDRWYGNTMSTERRRMKVYKNNVFNDTNIIDVWMYLTPPRYLFKWNPHNNEYRFPSTFIARPVSKTVASGKSRYEVIQTVVG